MKRKGKSMELQLQPNAWSCLPTAFAMCMNVNVKELINRLGHNGSKIEFNDAPEPYNRRSFHIQEIFDVMLFYNFVFTEIEYEPHISGTDESTGIPVYSAPESRMKYLLSNFDFVFIGSKINIMSRHAVAWSHKDRLIFDPQGKTYNKDKFIVRGAYLITRMGH